MTQGAIMTTAPEITTAELLRARKHLVMACDYLFGAYWTKGIADATSERQLDYGLSDIRNAINILGYDLVPHMETEAKEAATQAADAAKAAEDAAYHRPGYVAPEEPVVNETIKGKRFVSCAFDFCTYENCKFTGPITGPNPEDGFRAATEAGYVSVNEYVAVTSAPGFDSRDDTKAPNYLSCLGEPS